MLVDAPRLYIRPIFSIRLENNKVDIDSIFESRINLRSASVVLKCSMYRLLLNHINVLLNIICSVLTIEPYVCVVYFEL